MMKSLQDIRLFIQVAQTGSLSATARELGMTPAAVSAAIKRLEAEIQCQLLLRSTRSLRLTHDGEMFLTQARQAVHLLDSAVTQIHDDHQQLSGRLQVSVPSDLGRNVLLPWIDEFLALHPKVSVRLFSTDEVSDVYSEPIDVAFRYGSLPDSSLMYYTLDDSNTRTLVASPAYLTAFGTPQQPDDLKEHQCISFVRFGRVYDDWVFGHGEQQRVVQVNCDRVANDADVVKRWTLSGFGISYRSWLDVADEIMTGELVEVCPHWGYQALPLRLMYADKRQLTPLISAFRTFMKQRIDALAANRRML